ncbi:MAG: M28 family peptidase [Gemmatimonadaceae bacterium]
MRFVRLVLLTCVALPLAAQGTKRPVRPAWPDEGPATWAPRPTSRDITANDLRTRLYQLADDSMSGRRIGEPGNYKATAYIAAEFKRLGLKPAGDNGTYFQELPFGPVGYDVAASHLTVNGSELTVRTDWVPMAASPATGIGGVAALAGVPTVFAGRWGDSVALDPALVRGKVAVFMAPPNALGSTPAATPASLPRCDSVPDRFGAAAAVRADVAARAGTAPANRPTTVAPIRDTRAQTAGAAGILVIAAEGITPGAISAAFGSRMSLQPTTAGASATPVGATITAPVAARIFGKPADQLAVGATGQSISASWSASWRMSATPARNVIAILPGSDPARAAEYVLVGAHNDHVGTSPVAVDHDSLRAVNTVTRRQGANDPACRPTADQQRRIDALIAHARSIRPPRRDSVFNGADDDGSGTVVMLEIAERFAAERPARSIVFISHQGEEGGLLGSRWFVDHPTIPLNAVVAAHNMDMVGKGRVEQVKFGGPTSVQMLGSRRLSREFGDIIDSVNAVRSETMAIDKTWDVTANPMNRFCRSDQVNYVRKDVPVTYFSLGYAQDYHQLTDEPAYIDYDHAARLGRFIHDVMWAISERATRPSIDGPDPAYPRC